MQRPSRVWLVCGIAACCIAAVGIVVPIPSIVEVADCPPGTEMRPMWATMMLCFSWAAGLCAVWLAWNCLIDGWNRRGGRVLGFVALALGVVAIFGDTMVFNHIVEIRGYVMQP